MAQTIQKRLVKLGVSSAGFVVPNYLIKANLLEVGKEYTIVIEHVEQK